MTFKSDGKFRMRRLIGGWQHLFVLCLVSMLPGTVNAQISQEWGGAPELLRVIDWTYFWWGTDSLRRYRSDVTVDALSVTFKPNAENPNLERVVVFIADLGITAQFFKWKGRPWRPRGVGRDTSLTNDSALERYHRSFGLEPGLISDKVSWKFRSRQPQVPSAIRRRERPPDWEGIEEGIGDALRPGLSAECGRTVVTVPYFGKDDPEILVVIENKCGTSLAGVSLIDEGWVLSMTPKQLARGYEDVADRVRRHRFTDLSLAAE